MGPLIYMYDPAQQKEMSSSEALSAVIGTTEFNIENESHYYMNFFIGNVFSSNRVFLVGDAAHSWPAMGGTGGNTAYGDVCNLAWKMAHACKLRGGKALPCSYDIERRQHDTKIGLWVLHGMGAVKPEAIVKFVCSKALRMWLVRRIFQNMWLRMSRGRHRSQHFAQEGLLFGFKILYTPIMEMGARSDDPVS